MGVGSLERPWYPSAVVCRTGVGRIPGPWAHRWPAWIPRWPLLVIDGEMGPLPPAHAGRRGARGERTDGRCTEKQRAGGCADCRMARQAPPRFCAPCPLQQCSWAWRPRGGTVLADVCFVSRCLSRTRCQTVRQSSKMPTCPVRRPRLEEPGSRLPLPAGQRRVGRVRGHRVPTICGAG